MKNLLYKELKLAKNVTMFLFPVLGALLLIPSYSYYAAFIYTCLTVFFIFQFGRENKDIFFTVSLPVARRDAVKARFWLITLVELIQVACAVPFAFLGEMINPDYRNNMFGIEANVALFAFVIIMYALFNAIFMPMFYKTGYKVGIPLLTAFVVITLYIAAVEFAVQWVDFLKDRLDTTEPSMLMKQIPVLIAAMALYAFVMILAYKRSAGNFEKVDL